jgi:hypothetical protein
MLTNNLKFQSNEENARNKQQLKTQRVEMTTTSNNMECPVCRTNIKLRQIYPIQKFPTVRACPSCGTALCFALPRWIVPLMLIAGIVGGFVVLFAMQSLGVGSGSVGYQAGRSSKAQGTIGGWIIAAILLPAFTCLARRKMQISVAGREDMRNYTGR